MINTYPFLFLLRVLFLVALVLVFGVVFTTEVDSAVEVEKQFVQETKLPLTTPLLLKPYPTLITEQDASRFIFFRSCLHMSEQMRSHFVALKNWYCFRQEFQS